MSLVRIQLSGHPKYPLVVVWAEGKRERRHYARCQRDAALYKKKKEAELAHIAPTDTPATPEEHRAVLHARVHRVPLFEAVEHWRDTLGKASGVTLADLCDLRHGEATGENHSDRHRKSLDQILPRIAGSDIGKKQAATLTPEDLTNYIRTKGAPATQRYYRAILSGVFQSAMRAGTLAMNPATLVKIPKGSTPPPEVFSPEQAGHWLSCVALEAPALLAGTCIGMFAGLRVAEVSRLDWSEVRFDRGFIEVTASKSKTRTRRLVDLMPNLVEWIWPLRADKGPIWPHTVRRLKDRAVLAYGSPPPENGARHSFVSYHLALLEDVAKTELQAGHDRAVLFGHYRELVTRDEAVEFFTIVP